MHPHEKRPFTRARTEASCCVRFSLSWPDLDCRIRRGFVRFSDNLLTFPCFAKKWLLKEGIMGNQFKQRFKVTDVMMFFLKKKVVTEGTVAKAVFTMLLVQNSTICMSSSMLNHRNTCENGDFTN